MLAKNEDQTSYPVAVLPGDGVGGSRRIVLAHSGGGGLLAGEAITAAVFCPNIYLELSTLLPHQVLEVVGHVPATRLMIGSDLPENSSIEFEKILGLEIEERESPFSPILL